MNELPPIRITVDIGDGRGTTEGFITIDELKRLVGDLIGPAGVADMSGVTAHAIYMRRMRTKQGRNTEPLPDPIYEDGRTTLWHPLQFEGAA